MATLVCLNCATEFEVPQAWVKSGRRKFCSQKCKGEYQKTLRGAASPRQGKPNTPEARAAMSQAAQLRERQRLQRSEQHPAWRGGTFMSHGYRYLMIETLSAQDQELARPMTTSRYIQEHRIVMARTLGRPLLRSESVHHINGEKADNRPENLELLGGSEHSRQHREMVRELGRLRQQNHLLMSLLLISLNPGGNTST